MAKINKLTPEQEADLSATRDKWLDIGLSTAPIDREASKAAVAKMYECAGLPAPNIFIFLDSPRQGAIAAVLLKDSKLGAQVRAQVWAQVRAQVRDQVWAQVGDQVGAQVWDQVWDQVGDQVWAQVGDQVGAQVGQAAKDGINNDGASNIGWAGYAAWVSFFRDVCGWRGDTLSKFEISETLVKSCGWTWWHENVLAISDRPKTIKRDNEGRLHCENGPSIAYRDGWSMHHWHGVSIPPEWVTGKKPSAKEALHWPNVEQRRAACEILGWQHILAELDAKVIDKDDDAQIGTLLEVNLPDSGPERFLSVRCGTGRQFALPVPREVDTALAANAWTYGLDKLSFKPEIRT